LLEKPLIAIDIGSSAVKVVEVVGGKEKKLRSLGVETLPAGTVVDGMIQNQDAVIDVLKELLKKQRIQPRGRRAALALSGSSVYVKKVMVVAKDDVALGEQAYYEMEQQFQVPMEEIYRAYAKIQAPPTDNPDEKPVLLVAAKREMVEQQISVVRACGMRTGVIECAVLSTANMFEHNYGVVEGLMAIVNVGASLTQVSIVSRGQYVYTRDVPIAGEEYSRRIMEGLNVDHDNAESLKITASQGEGGVPPELLKVLTEVNEQLVTEVQSTVDYFVQSGDLAAQGATLSGIFLTGGGARVLGLDAAMAAGLSVQVHILNPFQRVEVNPKRFQMDYLLMQGHLYGVAVGLSLRSVGDDR
jgi:type IV pilus assembly protein PilM